jgi:hypothetical protein
MSLLQTSKKIAFTIAVSLGAVFALAFYTPAYALTISPARIEINGDPGATVGGEFTLINEQATSQTFYVSYENFSAQGETGTPSFSSEQVGLDTWLGVVPPEVTIAPGQAVKIPYTINIPADADPGGYFAAIFWSTTPPSTSASQVSIGAKIGLLVLLRVNGDIRESGGITQFDRNGHGFFYTALPVSMRYKFRNDGADRVEPSGTMTIRDTVYLPAAHLDANEATGNILPGSVRQFTVDWLKYNAPMPKSFFGAVQYEWKNFAVGLYSAHLDLVYGSEQLHAKKVLWFFVFPWQLLILIFVGGGILWFAGKKLISRYNAYIIKQAQAGMINRDGERS